MSKTMHRALGASTLAVTSLLVAACGGGGNGGGDAAGADSEEVEVGPADVTIVNFAYEDPEFTTTAGSTVTWVNEGAAPHTVTGEGFDSSIIRSGRGWTHTFEEPGTYEYWCSNHESMTGTIVVE
ncbi:plastocyanin/azurin family copper-binding protein [Actinomarinicola tropica]|uniref:Blue (type 1) copper domain-containing protein n=1 Tax=Actinomarinicola tropica TaxID=2789776 RepID=A0A5Q2RME6_9ACTN|nr:plastocyanin/azurin family copper-binding protein [Actinomarinicola tropica]QGG95596.1 hypothetical protein GH723_11085 [Actinomarinicola tropica]